MKTFILYVLGLASVLAFCPELILAQVDSTGDLEKRDFDKLKIFDRKRNAHACIMSVVFIVLYPLGAISVHLPIDRMPFLRNTYLKQKIMAIHAPIQLLGAVMMVGGMALGIRITHDLGYFESVDKHIIIGLLVCCVIILVQPILGIIQHQHYKRTGGKGVFAYVHRWVGRCAIVLGMINNGLGFQLASNDIVIPTRTYVRNFTLMGVLVAIWLGLILYDQFRVKQGQTANLESEKVGFEGRKNQDVTTGHDET